MRLHVRHHRTTAPEWRPERTLDLGLDLQHFWQQFHLRAAQCSVEVGQAIVVSNLVMNEFVGMRHLGRGGQVLGAARQCLVVGDNHAAAAGGSHLIAIEAKRGQAAKSAGVATADPTPEGFGRVLDHANSVLFANRHDLLDAQRNTKGMHGHAGGDAAPAHPVPGVAAAKLSVFGQPAS